MSGILGTGGNDTITSSFVSSGVIGGVPGTLNDTIFGAGGNDSLNGGAGVDIISGGEGDDTLTGEGGNDSLLGDSGLDWVSYSFVADTSAGVTVNLATGFAFGSGVGSDTLSGIENVIGGAGRDVIVGNSAANILISASTGADDITGGAGADTLVGGTSWDNWLWGGDDNDSILGGSASFHYLRGDAGNDTIVSGSGYNHRLDGGNGDDSLVGYYGAELYGSAGNDTLRAGSLRSELLQGDEGNDLLLGSTANDTLRGFAGDDTLVGGGGTDWAEFYSGFGGVTVDLNLGRASGASGNDSLAEIENIYGGSWSDLLIGNNADNRLRGGSGSDTLIGGNGVDWFLFLGDGNWGGPEQSVTVDLVSGRAVFSNSTDVDSLIGIENVGLYYGNDSILGNGLGNALEGSRGNDTIAGAGGDDTIHGGGGNDSLDGGSGNNDWIIYGSTELTDANSRISATINLATGRATVTELYSPNGGLTGNDSFVGFENIFGSDGNDLLIGDDNGNVIFGGAGSDTLLGGNGVDTLDGGGGSDWLDFGDGSEVLRFDLSQASGGNNKWLDGGAGNDTLYLLYGTEGNWVQASENGWAAFTYPGPWSYPSAYARNWEVIIQMPGPGINASLMGDHLPNLMYGGAGNDTFVGAAGADTMLGDQGNDWFFVQDLSDTAFEVTGAGSDTIMAMVSITVPNNIEMTIVDPSLNSGLRINGSSNHEFLVGNQFSDTLYGNAGDDTIQGGLGSNFLSGGEGDDVILTGNTSIAQVYALFT
jgi:Ca2+-binding RTX toxin-like protein